MIVRGGLAGRLKYLYGWHYTLAAWFVRCALFWPLAAELARHDLFGHWRSLHHFRNRGEVAPLL